MFGKKCEVMLYKSRPFLTYDGYTAVTVLADKRLEGREEAVILITDINNTCEYVLTSKVGMVGK